MTLYIDIYIYIWKCTYRIITGDLCVFCSDSNVRVKALIVLLCGFWISYPITVILQSLWAWVVPQWLQSLILVSRAYCWTVQLVTVFVKDISCQGGFRWDNTSNEAVACTRSLLSLSGMITLEQSRSNPCKNGSILFAQAVGATAVMVESQLMQTPRDRIAPHQPISKTVSSSSREIFHWYKDATRLYQSFKSTLVALSNHYNVMSALAWYYISHLLVEEWQRTANKVWYNTNVVLCIKIYFNQKG